MTVASALRFLFADAGTAEWLALAGFLPGFLGAGFVIGIRVLAERTRRCGSA
ncbi:MAG: hypothetical protein IT496_12210 [Gammaproteobacteria bacterium]|nr:hypothetical protein [Gammaproteobacteria bacterium]MCG3142916.1 hypothetical protein [Gammaproteobacteria bacterium]